MKRLLCTMFLSALASQAAISLQFDGMTPNGTDTEFTYHYTAVQTQIDSFTTGSYFTVYDIGEFISAGTPSPAWAYTAQPVGFTPCCALPPPAGTEDPNAMNVTFRYIGAGSVASNISGFSLVSRWNIANTPIAYTSETIKNQAPNPIYGSGQVLGPASTGNEPAVPEPATMGLMGGALAGLGLYARRRKK